MSKIVVFHVFGDLDLGIGISYLAIFSSSILVKRCTIGVTLVTTSVVDYAHLHGLRIHIYQDDWLLCPI